MRTGRPSKYKPEHCQTLLDLMAEGFSIQAVAAELEINQDTVFTWIKSKKDFSEAYKRGKMLQHAWWEKAGRSIALGGKSEKFDSKRANPTIFIWMTKNLLNWRDRQDLDVEMKGASVITAPQVILSLPDNGRSAKPD